MSQGQPGVYDVGDDKVEYKYDYMGRRVEQKILTCTAGGQNPTWQATGLGWLRFVYDGWNLVMVLNGSDNSLNRTYTWGLDLSGTIHGAGGIGGLLAQSGGYWFFYDANGNVGQIMQGTTIAAKYVYDPYGNVIEMGGQGAFPGDNPIRFSTKWFDTDFAPAGSGLGNWGQRPYSSRFGRWLRQDPIEEEGGLNLYVSLANNPTNEVDPVGQVVIGLWGFDIFGPEVSGEDTIRRMAKEIAAAVGDENVVAALGTGFGTSQIDKELRKWVERLETSCQPEQFVLFGFSDGGTSVWREIRHPYEAKYLAAVTDSTGKVRNPAYFGVIDMVRRWYIRPPLLRLIGEPPNDQTDRETESELNATLKAGPTIVENYRNRGRGSGGNIFTRSWRGFKLRGLSGDRDHGVEKCYHDQILGRINKEVVQNAIDAYRSVQP